VKPRITLITLGVEDLERAVRFYRDGLGLKTHGIVGTKFEHGAVAFFDFEGGLRLALFSRDNLSHDSGLARSPPATTDVALAHNVGTRSEVDSVMAEAKSAGARIVKSAVETFYGGYAGYFQDPDGHLWEIAWNPDLLPQD
jgi:catechol 2,3-dioxygenase-like lactoylglutathione lyase family enzyme